MVKGNEGKERDGRGGGGAGGGRNVDEEKEKGWEGGGGREREGERVLTSAVKLFMPRGCSPQVYMPMWLP